MLKDLLSVKQTTTGKIVYGNDYFSEVAGYKESELIGAPHNILASSRYAKSSILSYVETSRKMVEILWQL